MKKILLIACSIGALIACNKEDIAGVRPPEGFSQVNQATQESIPVYLRITGGVTTKATTSNPQEDEVSNALLTVKGYDSESKVIYTNTYDISGSSDVIINLTPCTSASFTVESGPVLDGAIQKALEYQKTNYYAVGEVSMSWNDLQAQGKTHEIELVRQINKITIEKISVDWDNPNYNNKELRIKKIYLCDVPRYPNSTYEEVVQSLYKKDYTGTKVDFQYYNFYGLETFTYKPSNVTFVSDIHRLDDQLLDEVDAVISENKPYQTPHIFYSYLCNNTNTTPKVKYTQGDRYAFTAPMTTIAIEAELNGTLMYYRFPILQFNGEGSSAVPMNTHIKFKELIIKDLGAPTLYGDKTFENVNFTLIDWSDDIRSGSTENF